MSQQLVPRPSSNPAVELMPSPAEWTVIQQQANTLVKSGFLPTSIKTPEQAIAIALKGRELGIPMMQAFAHINIIQGKPTMSSELMLAQIRRLVPGATINYIERSDERCIIEASRPGSKLTRFEFNLNNAKEMGLLGKDNWKKQSKIMLQWRCVSEMARAMFSDSLMGVSYTPEEINPDLRVSEEGEIIDVTPASKAPQKTLLEQPAAHVAPAPVIDVTPDHSADYVPRFGKYKENTLAIHQLDRADITSYANSIRNAAAKQRKKVTGPAAVFIEEVDRLVNPTPQADIPPPPPDYSQDIPF